VGAQHEHATSASRGSADNYARHRPEETVLYSALQAHWKTFISELEAAAEPPVLPAFVISEVEAFLRCGILAQGLILAKCRDCGWCRPVAFACRRRGFCPSCLGRRMSDFATQLVDRVIPRVPVRQWVLTVPHGLRAKMMFDPALTSAVLRELIRAVSSWLRQRARRLGVVGALKTGAVTVIQRFNSALGASPHFHTLFADGVYSFPVGRAPVFHPTPAPTDEDVARVAAAVFRRVERRLADREPAAVQRRFVEGAPVLVALTEASVGGVVATGPRRGRRIVRVRGAAADLDAFVMGRLCAEVEGSISRPRHASTPAIAKPWSGWRAISPDPRLPPTDSRGWTTDASSCGSSAPGETARRRSCTRRTSSWNVWSRSCLVRGPTSPAISASSRLRSLPERESCRRPNRPRQASILAPGRPRRRSGRIGCPGLL
jgi:hypothetical protein